MDETLEKNRIFSDLNTGRPLASFKKQTLGKVFVSVWDSYEDKPKGVLLTGNPRNNDESCIVDMWSEKEVGFFKRTNKSLLDTGAVLPFTRPVEEEKPKTFEESTDEELLKFLGSRYFTIQNKLNKITTTPVLFRLVDLAREAEKSEKIVKLVEARISELQEAEYTAGKSDEEEEA